MLTNGEMQFLYAVKRAADKYSSQGIDWDALRVEIAVKASMVALDKMWDGGSGDDVMKFGEIFADKFIARLRKGI